MKATFDPAELRRRLAGDTGIEWALSYPFEEVHRVSGLSSWADAQLAMAVQCILVGHDTDAARLAKRAREWLTIAVQEDEPHRHFRPDFVRAMRYFNLAQCTWLLEGTRDEGNLKRFAEHKRQYFAQAKLDRIGVSMSAVEHLDAGDDQATLDLLLRAGIGPPSSFAAIRMEGQLAYVICRKRLGQAYVDVDVNSAVSAFLKKEVNGWLIDGHDLRAAMWMKIAHWREAGPLSPQETIRKAYDYLPGVSPL